MSALVGYGSSDEEEDEVKSDVAVAKKRAKAPQKSESESAYKYIQPVTTSIKALSSPYYHTQTARCRTWEGVEDSSSPRSRHWPDHRGR